MSGASFDCSLDERREAPKPLCSGDAMRFSIGNIFKTGAWGRITIADIHAAIIQIEQDSGVRFWVPFDTLREEIKLEKSNTNESSENRELPGPRRRLKTRRSRSLQKADAISDQKGRNNE
jgi:hypothetical protein